MSRVGDVLRTGRAALRGHSEHPARDAVLLLSHVLGKPTSYPHLYPEDEVPSEAESRYMELIRRRKDGEPVAYLRGYQEFMGIRFAVDPRVLIPRPETEILVEAAVDELQGAGACRVADLCCGSGAIGLSLAGMLPDCEVSLSDCSPGALEVARKNASLLGLGDRVRFFAGDLAAPLLAQGLGGAFDLVASNPPYIASEDLDRLPREVRRFEPEVALDGGPGGLCVIERLVLEAPLLLRSGGLLLMEIDHGQGERCLELFSRRDLWQEPRVMHDYAGRQRVVSVRRT